MNPYFSVIIPVYNRAQLLERSLGSVLKQSFRDFEVIVVDDGSDDHFSEAITKFQDLRLKVIRLSQNHGVSFARNRAVEKSKGSFLAFLDSDDEWLAHKLQDQYDFFQLNPEMRWCHAEEIWIRNGKRVNPKNKHKKGGGDLYESSLKLCLISPSVVCLESSLFQEFGGFREDFEVCEDYDLWLKITSKFPIGYLSQHLIKKYGGHEDQLSQKYKAMDDYRVQAMDWMLENGNLNGVQKQMTVEELLKKAKILEMGYEKHKRQEDLQQIRLLISKWS